MSVSTLTGVLLKLLRCAFRHLRPSDAAARRGHRVRSTAISLSFISDLNLLTLLRLFTAWRRRFAPQRARYRRRPVSRTAWGSAGHLYGLYTIRSLAGPVHRRIPRLCGRLSSAFLTAGLVGCIAIVLFYSLRLTPPPPRNQDKGLAPVMTEMWKGFSIVARNRKVLITSSTDAAKMIANGALMAFLPLYGVGVGLNAGEVGLLFTVQSLTSFFSKPIMGRVSDRVGRQPLIMLGLVICAVTFVCIPHVASFAVLVLLTAGSVSGEAVVSSSSSAFVA